MPECRVGLSPLPALFIALPLGSALTGCSQHAVPVSNGLVQQSPWVCEAFLPITPAPETPAGVRQQIIEHNAVWDALCKG